MYGVVQAAYELGYKVVALHSLPLNAPPPYEQALAHIDSSVCIKDWYDFEGLMSSIDEAFNQYTIVGTYAAAEITLCFEAYFRQIFSLPGNSLSCVETNLNKCTVRKTLVAKGLSTLTALSQQQTEALAAWPFDGAAYFKPANGSGSAAVTRCSSMEDLRKAQQAWEDKDNIAIPVLRAYIEKNNQYFLEQEAVGELLSVESFVVNKQVHVLGLTSRTVLNRDKAIEMGANFPYEHPQKTQIIAKVKAIHQALNIQHGATHTEVVISSRHDIELVEINLRFAGADLLYIASLAFKHNLAAKLVALITGEDPKMHELKPVGMATMQYILAPNNTPQFNSIEFPKDVTLFKAFKKPGTMLGASRNQIDHIGGFVLEADSSENLIQSTKNVRQLIRVNDAPLGDDINNQVTIN